MEGTPAAGAPRPGIVPLVRTESGGIPAERLNPVFRVEGIDVLMSAAELAALGFLLTGV